MVANSLGVKEEVGHSLSQTLTDFLKAKKLLLLLDNCEHLVGAVAHFCNVVLKKCPNVTLLATSRESLNLSGETQFRVSSLSLPAPNQTATQESLSQYEAVRLFIERASLVQSAFAVTNENAPSLAQLCVQLDGIPLAIELAAARARSLSVEEINRKLDNRFRLLTGGSRNVLPRQQTLRALIDWSYDLLTEPGKALLRRLSVFAGGWTQEAAEAVGAGLEAWETLDLLTGLADKSLVFAESGATTRYRLMETVKQYAAEKLRENGEADAARRRHLEFYLALTEEMGARLNGLEAAQWLNQLETEHDNARAALNFAAETEEGAEAGLRIAASMASFWNIRGYLTEGRALLEQALAKTSAAVEGIHHANALSRMCYLVWFQGELGEARGYLERALAIQRNLADDNGIARSLNGLGVLASDIGDYALARTFYNEALPLFRKVGNRIMEAAILSNTGYIVLREEDGAAAKLYFEDSLEISRAVGHLGQEAWCLRLLAGVAVRLNDYTAANALFADSLRINQKIRDIRGIAYAMEGIAALSAKEGRLEHAARLWGAA